MLSFENVARNARGPTVPEAMYDAVELYLGTLPNHPSAFTPLPIQAIQWTLPFEPVTPLTTENTFRAPFTTKKALQNKSNPTRYSPFAENNKPIIRQVLPQWFRQAEAHPLPPPPPPQLFFQNSSASWSAWLPQQQQAPQQPEPMTVRPLQPELQSLHPPRITTHRPPTLHWNVSNPATMTAHSEIPPETELTTAIQGLRINPESPKSCRGRNNANASNKRRRNRKKHAQHPNEESVHKDTQIPPQNENEESPPLVMVNNISSENKREERSFGQSNHAAGGDEIMNTHGRGSQGQRGGRAGRGGRRHRPINVEQPSTQQTPVLPPPLPLFSNGAASTTDASPVEATTTTGTTTTPRPMVHQIRPQHHY